ncbi:hypothetical protein GUJ93_ZPchr0001g30301 [Zizania palustris]|uniref:Jacalin-type lectin domain-containing protein n=1 Tax=Zizania palustris TaxID=103762 RepID=A0A8J5VQ05_ZIZPA|nr:hypothetical protein GUJ93_ZPchr0001g30301 [Zizania palustris]
MVRRIKCPESLVHMLQLQQPAHNQRKMVASSRAIKVGPWGGAAGSAWDDGAHRGVRSITVTYWQYLESLTVEYDMNGQAVVGEKHGGGGGGTSGIHVGEIKLDYPYESLTGVGGRYGPVTYGGSPVVRSLTFRTSRGTVHGPFGNAAGGPEGCRSST